MSYRHIYENFYNTKIKEGYEIHHINFIHTDNNPYNLVELPKQLHRNLHKAYNELIMWDECEITIHTSRATNQTEYIQALYNYIYTVECCTKYMNEREILKNAK